jgi:hypothetical protein
MVVVQFFENKTLVLTQLRKQVPSVDENIKIKGRKGKVLSVNKVDENKVNVQVQFEKVIKNQPILKDNKKKR